MKTVILQNLIFFLFITLISFSINAQQTNKEKWRTDFNQGKEKVELTKYNESLPLLKSAYKLAQQIFTDSDQEFIETLHYLAMNYTLLTQFDKALPLLELNLELVEKTKGKEHEDYAECLHNLGYYYNSIGEYDKAEFFFLQSLPIIEKTQGKLHEDYANTINSLAILFSTKGDKSKAVEMFKESLSITEQKMGKENPNYITQLGNLAVTLQQMGKYKESLPLFLEGFGYLEKTVGKNNLNYALYGVNIGLLYYMLGDYQKSLTSSKEAKAIIEKLVGNNHFYYGIVISNIAMNYLEAGDINNALVYFLESEKVTKNTVGIKSPQYGIVLGNIAVAYQTKGDYKNALIYVDKTLLQVEETLGNTHENYVTFLSNKVVLYQLLGDYDKGILTGEEALIGIKNSLGSKHEVYARCLNNIANIYIELNDFEKAKEMLEEASEITYKTLGKDHIYNGTITSNLGITYHYLKDYDKALEKYEEAAENIETNFGKDHYKYGMQLNGIAMLYANKQDYNKAISNYNEAYKVVTKSLGKKHSISNELLNNLGITYFFDSNYEKGTQVLNESNENKLTTLKEIFTYRSENEKKKFISTYKNDLDQIQSLLIKYKNTPIKLIEINLNNQLVFKGLLLNSTKDLFVQLETLNDSVIDDKIFEYRSFKTVLNKQYNLSIDERTLDLDSLKNILNTKETNLVKLYSHKFNKTVSIKKDWKDVKTKLSKNEIAIEFSNFAYRYEEVITDSLLYVAYIYKKDWEHPKMIPLFEEKQLNSLLKGKTPNELYTSNALYNLILKPLRHELNGVKTIYYSPSGLLNQIQFAALKDEKILGNTYNLIQLSSTAVLEDKLTEPSLASTLFVGGINYDYTETLDFAIDSTSYAYLDTSSLKRSKATKTRGESWTNLPGTLKEIEGLQSIFKSKGYNYSTLSGKEATEVNFKKLSGNSPNILHISTHGFFYENLNLKPKRNIGLSTEDKYRLSEDPLLRSGLILAGANYAWKHGSNPNEEEDGILTALEISNMDLSNTDIVVLSACETGLGDIDGSEGVYGLQRAFKMAGVNIVVMSLWQVPDLETAEFMNLFYSNWVKNKNVRKAFKKAQQKMKKKYKDEPLKWAAFVMFE